MAIAATSAEEWMEKKAENGTFVRPVMVGIAEGPKKAIKATNSPISCQLITSLAIYLFGLLGEQTGEELPGPVDLVFIDTRGRFGALSLPR